MYLSEVKNKQELDSFVAEDDFSQFLQSYYWREISKDENIKTLMYVVKDDNENIILSALLLEYNYSFFKYYYIPRGPIISKDYQDNDKEIERIIDFFYKELIKVVDSKVLFLRLEPKFNLKNIDSLGIKKTLPIQAQKTRLLDLDKSIDSLFSDMHSKTRYNIRLAKKKDVEVFEGKFEDLDKFFDLLNTTGKRKSFGLHKKSHYESLIKKGAGKVKLFFASHEDQIIAGAMFSFFGDTVTYLHGASANTKRNLMSPHLMQWQLIKMAKDKGYRYYDFGGIDKERWPGVSRFKAGFGGREYDFPGTFDVIIKPFLYYSYNILRKIRRKFL